MGPDTVAQLEPAVPYRVGPSRHGSAVSTAKTTQKHPWLTELMCAVLGSIAPEAEYTTLCLTNSGALPMSMNSANVAGSTTVMLPLKLPPDGGDLWVELRAGDVVHGPVEKRVESKGQEWLGTSHKLQCATPFSERRHSHSPSKGEGSMLVAHTVNALGKVPECGLQALQAFGFPLPSSAHLPLTVQQDVRRLSAFRPGCSSHAQ